MQADWTRPSERISNYLATFGRYGIPFDAVYGPGAPNGIPLPELLSEDAVIQALDQAAKPST
jgi:suppressor for copper-sensitivity B